MVEGNGNELKRTATGGPPSDGTERFSQHPPNDGKTGCQPAMTERRETRAWTVDVVETLVLLLLPALLVGLVTALGSDESVVTGLFVGGVFGAMLAGYRRAFYAVRTVDGIERRLRPRDGASDHWMVRIAEYDGKYEWLLAALLLALGIVVFALQFARLVG